MSPLSTQHNQPFRLSSVPSQPLVSNGPAQFNRSRTAIACLVGAALITLFGWLWCPLPALTLVLAFGVSAISVIRFSRHRLPQNLALACASLFFTLGAMEAATYLATAESRITRVETTPHMSVYYRDDKDLGYAPRPGMRVEARKYHDTDVVYDVIYTIDRTGLRQVPESLQGEGCPILFFADSLTFGEGVKDDQAMPAAFLKASHGRFHAYNFGFHGYGPHQMLRALEVGRVEQLVSDRPAVVVYQGIEGHVARAAGKVQWDLYGPRYRVSGNTVEFVGPFHGTAYKIMHEVLKYSVFLRFLEGRLIERNSESEDIARYVNILERARKTVETQYHARFVVLFWDKGQGDQISAQVFEQLRERHFDLIPVSTILTDIEDRRAAYVLSEYDQHPNAHAHELIGQFLARQLAGSCGAR